MNLKSLYSNLAPSISLYLYKKTMKIINFKNYNKIYFVGIGGIGISAIARFLLLEGKEVCGSERRCARQCRNRARSQAGGGAIPSRAGGREVTRGM